MLDNLTPLEVMTLRAGLQELQTKCDQKDDGPDPGFIGITANDVMRASVESLLARLDGPDEPRSVVINLGCLVEKIIINKPGSAAPNGLGDDEDATLKRRGLTDL